MKTHSFSQIVFVLIFSLLVTGANAKEPGREMFEKIFQYELNNRAFAYISVSNLAKKMENTEQAEFWHAYMAMEQFSQPLYRLMSEKYGLQVNSFIVTLKVWSTNLAFSIFPEKMLTIMAEATGKYVEKLAPLPELAKTEDRVYFEYIVAQERAQAIALNYAVNERLDLARATLENFLTAQNRMQLDCSGEKTISANGTGC